MSLADMKNIRLSKYYAAVILLITFFWTSVDAASQNGTDSSQLKTVAIQHSSGYKTTMLRLGGSIGYGVYRDMGTAPFSFKGVAVQPVVGIEFGGMRKWTTKIDIFTTLGAFEDAVLPKLNFGAFDISNTIRFSMRKQIEDEHFASFSVGFGAANFLDVTVNPDYENSAAGVSEFIGPELLLRADANLSGDFYSDKLFDKQLHAEIGLMPIAAVLRPGYAYIDNYTAAQPVLASLFDQFEWHLKPFAGIYTDIGLDLLNANNSRISISYRWSYHSSGNSGQWRFDHATHFLLIDFFITLKSKRTEWSRITEID